jgi:hypothetical protein
MGMKPMRRRWDQMLSAVTVARETMMIRRRRRRRADKGRGQRMREGKKLEQRAEAVGVRESVEGKGGQEQGDSGV